MRRAGWACLLVVLGAGCTRSFSAPRSPPDGGAPPPTLAPIDGGFFAGQVVVLTGSGFSAEPQANQVRVGSALAELAADGGAPSSTSLALVVPDLGPVQPGAAPPQVTVTVRGQTSNPEPLQYRGPGHPPAFALGTGTDLAPTAVSASVLGGLAMVSLLGNRVQLLVDPTRSDVVAFPAGAGALPFGTALSFTPDGAGLPTSFGAGIGLWGSEVFFVDGGEPRVRLRSNVVAPPPGYELDAVAEASSHNPLGGMVSFVPTPTAVVVMAEVTSADPRIPLLPVGAALLPGAGAGYDLSTGVTPLDGEVQYAFLPLDDGGVAPTGRLGLVMDASTWDAGAREILDVVGQAPDGGASLSSVVMTRDGAPLFTRAVALAPDGASAWVLAPGEFSSVDLLRVDAQTGQAALVHEVDAADSVAATSARVALSSVFDPVVRLFSTDPDAGPLGQVALDGVPRMLTRDPLDDSHLYVVVGSPPELVELDPVAATVVQRTRLNQALRVLAVSPDGSRLELTGDRVPGLVLLDANRLTQASDYQHVVGEGQAELSLIISGAFTGGDGGSTFCATYGHVVLSAASPGMGTVTAGLRCGPPDDLFGPRGVDAYAVDAGNGSSLTDYEVAPLSSGKVRVFGPDLIADCDPGQANSCDLRPLPLPAGILQVLPYGDGRAVVAANELLARPDGTSLQPLCTGPSCVTSQDFSGLAVDPAQRYVSVLAHETRLVDLQTGAILGGLSYLSDVPLSEAFSPDGTRLYVGTLLGHVDEYELSAVLGQVVSAPSRTQYAGFPVRQVVPLPDGSRLLLIDPQTDRVAVVQ